MPLILFNVVLYKPYNYVFTPRKRSLLMLKQVAIL